jgi:2-methylisocitrate lyase-like PEP mutase family enzyme
MVAKIRAAKDAAGEDGPLIIARSDARYLGTDEAIERLNRYLEAGADLAMIAESYPLEELRRVVGAVRGPVCILAGVPEWPETHLPAAAYEAMGVKLLLYALVAICVATKAVQDAYRTLRDTGHVSREYLAEHAISLAEINEVVGLPEWQERERRFAADAPER